MLDFRGNEIKPGDTVVYCPTNRFSGLVEATVVELAEQHVYGRVNPALLVQPIKEAQWMNRAATDRSEGRRVLLTNLHRVMKVEDAHAD